MPSRDDIARAAADALDLAVLPPALVGFDGFIDAITDMVDRRHAMTPDAYSRLPTIAAFAQRCAAAAGKSTNIERVVRERRFGGNGPLLAGALARLGSPTTYIGAVAPDAGTPHALHPAFAEFASWCRRVVPLGPPGETACLEFDDGKLMLNDTAPVQRISWNLLLDSLGLQALRDAFDHARILAIVNWSLMGGVPGIFDGILLHILPAIAPAPRRLFIDLSDPAKRSDLDIRLVLDQLARLNAAGLRVTLGLNLAEAARIDLVAGTNALTSAEPSPDSLVAAAAALRRALRLDTVVLHPRHGAAAASHAAADWFDGPFTSAPRLSTGAGDHFNAGFALGQALDLHLPLCLAIACAESGLYVRDARSPDRPRLVHFLRNLPPPHA